MIKNYLYNALVFVFWAINLTLEIIRWSQTQESLASLVSKNVPLIIYMPYILFRLFYCKGKSIFHFLLIDILFLLLFTIYTFVCFFNKLSGFYN